MGDISELRVLVVVGVLLSTFIFLGSLIPGQFMAGVVSGTATNVPSSFDASRLLGWNETADLTIQYFGYNESNINGYNIEVAGLGFLDQIETWTFAAWGPFVWDQDYFKYYRAGVDITNYGSPHPRLDIGDLDEDWAKNYSMTYSIRNSHTNFDILFAWNTTKYATPHDAYQDSKLIMVFNNAFNNLGSELNGWGLVTSLMSFSLPDVPTWIQYLIAVPIWIGLGYVAFIFILRMIGAVFGGGGS